MQIISVFLGLLLLMNIIDGAPVGNPSLPRSIHEGVFISSDSWIDLRCGYEGDFVADARMNQYLPQAGRVDVYEQWTNSGTVSLNILDRLDIYGVFGASRAEANWRMNGIAEDSISRIECQTDSNFLWGAGARLIIYEWTNACLGCGGRYSACDYGLASMTLDGAPQSLSDPLARWRQWQVNLDVSCKIDFFTPYIGVKYSHARTLLEHVPESIVLGEQIAFENRCPVGLYLGCGLSSGRYLMINLEARLIDEEAVTVSADVRF